LEITVLGQVMKLWWQNLLLDGTRTLSSLPVIIIILMVLLRRSMKILASFTANLEVITQVLMVLGARRTASGLL
jgi:hypothetical protein